MIYTFNIIKLSRKEEYLHWKTLIESFADDENSEEILYGSITLANATELLNKKDQCPEENEIETIKTANPNTEIIKAQNIFKKRNKKLFNALISSISTDIFNSIDIDIVVTRVAADIYKDICNLFEPEENLEVLQMEFLNRTHT